MNRRAFITTGIGFGLFAAISKPTFADFNAATQEATDIKKVVKTNAQWKRILTPAQFHVTREKGTEAPYSSPLNKVKQSGVFACVCCSLPLFSSRAKFESNTGWPSFWTPLEKQNVREEVDSSMAETRTEVLCARCDAHLGHVFQDGPEPTGLRYCMNGVALKFVKRRGRA